ncbi:MAG: hypothetical protein KAQ89_00135 [Planctomycetes bacterium]|nr:hypothetical protein [Planctomycetota bacterium]
MVESYLHKMAKELLYKEIEEKSGFEYKISNGEVFFKSVLGHKDYRKECVLMEFPTQEGYYPDEFGCGIENFEYFFQNEFNCTRSAKGYRFNTGQGYCKCSSCEHFNFNDTVVHDIAFFYKGNVGFAVEIVNKHEPSWGKVNASLPYDIYFVRAEDVLKRIDSTPVFVYKIIRTCYPE